jgi:hypothetical protein
VLSSHMCYTIAECRDVVPRCASAGALPSHDLVENMA